MIISGEFRAATFLENCMTHDENMDTHAHAHAHTGTNLVFVAIQPGKIKDELFLSCSLTSSLSMND